MHELLIQFYHKTSQKTSVTELSVAPYRQELVLIYWPLTGLCQRCQEKTVSFLAPHRFMPKMSRKDCLVFGPSQVYAEDVKKRLSCYCFLSVHCQFQLVLNFNAQGKRHKVAVVFYKLSWLIKWVKAMEANINLQSLTGAICMHLSWDDPMRLTGG